MPPVTMYSTQVCPYCVMAEKLLQKKGVPQIYIGETHVGGYDDLVALDRAGKLDPLLA
ncbi:MAG: hypothetical protein B7X60_15380 [Polynucleobacter sp. 39-45-136]|nr:MAG: hypothetical protein B7X60_15380 [Polynucleobacter sp. 39-45-136]